MRLPTTGQKSFPWKYDETAHDYTLLKEVLNTQIVALVNSGVMDFLSGMAEGVDIWATKAVLNLRMKNPTLKLHCILPCEGQESKWTASAQEQYHSVLEQADEVVYVSRAYHWDCKALNQFKSLRERNR